MVLMWAFSGTDQRVNYRDRGRCPHLLSDWVWPTAVAAAETQNHLLPVALANLSGVMAVVSAWTPCLRYLKKCEFEGDSVGTVNVVF